jgi:uncharacterized protein DUF3500
MRDFSRRDVFRIGLGVAGSLGAGPGGASGQPASSLRPRQRPPLSGRRLPETLPDGLKKYLATAEAAVAEPFKGITTDGTPIAGLFPLRKTGVSTQPIRDAADAFLASLDPQRRAKALFPVDTDTWRRWSNIHVYLMRHGVALDEMTSAQRERALALLRASLSQAGFNLARDVMKLNEVIGDITGRHDEYGEWLYWLSIMGAPSSTEPWGWQIDGHHVNVNCLVLGDQIVLTPMFLGSEPVAADAGRYAGTRVFQPEEQNGLAFLRALTPEQQAKTIIASELPGEVFTAAYRDNFELRYQGIRHDELTSSQQRAMFGLIDTYVSRIRPGHAQVRIEEVRRHLAETYFAWMGGVDADSVFYYRIHSPVILIEFDHQRGVALDNDQPSRNHVHTVVRTPNGNDYGKDLLRQHHAAFDHRRGAHDPPRAG